ncbi:sugar porter family MFS transporter [Fulvimonas sp. R45]|uniref:sugar porter family MFS transporter n=1 Tax=Fulvimonas sp. R45 TaxID=3045937 RepID=UPI00265FFD31|nr:sugar porter family MFS transporter [Fulvimonas sp. R45]MDO1529858.1 sugar porter family MFS transporter [Fulvimonas sp. R45]
MQATGQATGDAVALPLDEPPRGTTARVVTIVAAAALGGFLFGFDTAVINGAVDALRQGFGLGAGWTGFAVSCALLGSALGAWYAGRLADRYGRVRTMQVAAALLAASALGAGLAHGVATLVLWRVVGGLGVGVASVVAPTYIAEVSPARLRGRLGSMQQLAIVLGIFVALLSDAWLAGAAGGAEHPLWLGLPAWRWMFLAMLLPALVYGALVLGVPESPRHLVAKRRPGDALRVLRQVLGLADEDALQRKLSEIEQSLRREHAPRWRDLLGTRGGLLPVVWVGIALSVFQQFVGINVIFYYSSTLWHSVGFSEADAFAITVATSVINVAVTLVAIALVDRVGRKPLLVVGSAGMAATLALMAWCFAQASGSGAALVLPGAWGPLALVAANAYVIFFGLSWGPVVWVLLGEMFPNRIRAMALAVAAAAQWLANFAITSSFPAMAGLSLPFAYGVYAAFALASLLFVLRFVRETRGLELEQMRG